MRGRDISYKIFAACYVVIATAVWYAAAIVSLGHAGDADALRFGVMVAMASGFFWMASGLHLIVSSAALMWANTWNVAAAITATASACLLASAETAGKISSYLP